MHRRNRFLGRIYIFLILFFGLSAVGLTYGNWHSSLFIETKSTSGIMDVLFPGNTNENYSVSITDAEGNDIARVEAEFSIKDKELGISFDQGLPIKELMEGKLLRLEFPVSPSKESTVVRLNHTKFDPKKPGEILEIKAEQALLVNGGKGYFLGENEAMFTEPLKFEIYKVLTDDINHRGKNKGQIYLKLQEESIERLSSLPTNLTVNSEELLEYTEPDIKEANLLTAIGNGVVVTYSCEIPFYVFQQLPGSGEN